MGKRGKELAKERRRKRLQEISDLRRIPYAQDQRWWTSETVAVVTGSSRGIGYEIARQLASHGLTVVVTSRDEARGKEAVITMREESDLVNVEFCCLDVSDEGSILMFADWIKAKFGAIDILVNSAGVNFNTGPDNSVEFAEDVILTNYFGTKNMIKSVIPLMRHSTYGARILNVSSRLGRLNGRRNRLGDTRLREELSRDDCLSEELIDKMIANFLEQVKDGSWDSSHIWPQIYTDYSISKLAVNAYTRLMARILSDRPEGKRIYINSYCPGWVKTSMTAWEGNMSTEEGADTGVWTLLQSDPVPMGNFFAERREISF